MHLATPQPTSSLYTMKHRCLAALIVAVIAGVAARSVVAGTQAPPDADQLAAIYLEAFNARDASRFAALFAEDAVLMPPDTPLIRGRAAIETAYAGRFPLLQGFRLEMRRMDFETHDDRATVIGTFDFAAVRAEETPTVVGGAARAGKFVQIYKRVAGRWLIAFQIVNYDAPLPLTVSPR